MNEKPQAVEIFFCYAQEDQKICTELKKHLMPLQYNGSVTLWADTNIQAGDEWEKEIHQYLNTAQVILLLVSPDFINSSYCYGVEMQRALERHEHGDACVIPIISRPVDWKNTPFGKLQALPTDGLPITSRKWHRRDDAFLDVVAGIKRVIGVPEGNELAVVPASKVARGSEKLRRPGTAPAFLANRQKRFWIPLLLLGLVLLFSGISGGVYLLIKALEANAAASLAGPTSGSPVLPGNVTPTSPIVVLPTPTNIAQVMGYYYYQYTGTTPTQEYTPADTSQWFNSTPAYGACSKEGGYHVLPSAGSFAACIASLPVLTGDYAVQAAVVVIAGTGAGLAFGFSSQNSAYSGNYYLWSFCRISGCPARNVTLYYGLGGGSYCLGPDAGPGYSSDSKYCNATSQAVNVAAGQPNILTVIVLHAEIYLYVNATFITTIQSDYPTDGQVGIAAVAGSCKACHGLTDVSFQSLKIWRIQN